MSSRFREDSRRQHLAAHSWPTGWRARAACVACILAVIPATDVLLATDFAEEFDSEKPTWQIRVLQGTGARLQSHRRNLYFRRSGLASEQIQLRVADADTIVQFEHRLPQSAVVEEATLTIAVRANRPGLVPALQLVFPKQKDPRSGKTLTALLAGEAYTTPREWQTLKVEVNRRAVADRLVRLRAQLKPAVLDLSDVYIDRAILTSRLPPGTAEFFIDELHWTGYADLQTTARQTDFDTTVQDSQPDVEVRLDRLLIRGKPTVLRFAPHHDESAARLDALGLNAVWVNDAENSALIEELQDHNIWALVTPSAGSFSLPDPSGRAVNQQLVARQRGLLGYYLGTRIPPAARPDVENQVRQLQAADRGRKLPVFADIGGLEHAYSRMLDGVGLTRHPLQTDLSLHEYRRFLTHKRQQLRPGTLVTTWIQTEVDPHLAAESASERGPGNDPDTVPLMPGVVEPEQIRLLAWSALTAGFRGIGYWKRQAFDTDVPGAREREYAIGLINQEIELLEPWLSTHTVTDYERIPLTQSSPRRANDPSQRLITGSRARQLREDSRQQSMKPAKTALSSESSEFVELAMIHSPNGLLLVPIWYQPGAQYVPGRMVRRGLTITIPGIPDTASVWEVTTTRVRTLEKKPAPRGIEIRIDEFDQLAALVVATDPNWGRILREHIQGIRARSAAMWLGLARAKLERVRSVDTELQQLGAGVASSRHVLEQARRFLAMAEESYRQALPNGSDSAVQQVALHLNSSGFDATRRWSKASLQYVRVLQRKYWENAVRRHGVAAFSPYTISFQTLPDHWRLVRAIGVASGQSSGNLLPDGDFENTSTEQMIERGWRHTQSDVAGVQATAELTRLRSGTGFCLRLLASDDPNADLPAARDTAPVSVTSPPIPIQAGQLVHIRGRIHVPRPLRGPVDGASLSESLQGTTLRWHNTRDWQPFELVRQARTDQTLTLTMTLRGPGEVRFDDLRVVVSDISNAVGPVPESPAKAPETAPSTGRRGLEFLKRLPILR